MNFKINDTEKKRILEMHRHFGKSIIKEQTERQQAVNTAYCSVQNGVIMNSGSMTDLYKWGDYVKIFKVTDQEIKDAKSSCPSSPHAERQQAVNTAYCSVKNGVIINPGSMTNNLKWEDYVKRYTVTDQEINEAKSSCPNIGSSSSQGSSTSSSKPKQVYTTCTGEYKQNCKSEKIREVQACLGMKKDYQTGNFGPYTKEALKALGKGFENGFTDANVTEICNKTQATQTTSQVPPKSPVETEVNVSTPVDQSTPKSPIDGNTSQPTPSTTTSGNPNDKTSTQVQFVDTQTNEY